MTFVVMILAGGLELDETLFELRRDGHAVSLEPQAFDVLVHLVRNRDRVVTKDELKDTVWGGRFVSETAVTSRIKQVRRALGDDGRNQAQVRTLHGRGYRYVGSVDDPALGHEDGRSPVRYTVSDGLHVAYQVTGAGPVDLVLISGFVSHLDLDWDYPGHAHFLDRLGTMGRLIRFDKRGTGMSDRPAGVPDLETRMHDILAVMEAARSEQAVLFGYSEGVPMALLMAALHPERVRGLVLYAGYSRRTRASDYPWARSDQDRQAHVEQLIASWDWVADLRMRCPSADRAMELWWQRRMGAAATPSTVRALWEMNSLVDVRDVLPSVAVPTIVLHRVGDEMFHSEESAFIADRVPGATLRLLDGRDHLPWADGDQVLDEVAPFVAALPEPSGHRALAAVVAVGGTGADTVLTALSTTGGRPRVRTDGTAVVLFDGPATAVRALGRVLHPARRAAAGLAIAEVTVAGGPVEGPGVDDAVALSAIASAGEILVSDTAAALLAGSGISLEAAGRVSRVLTG
jgi:DNA-binding winged helix-turn-helix (wHTH) protein/pimeloyl-ACP methyl ester carboxylesterase